MTTWRTCRLHLKFHVRNSMFGRAMGSLRAVMSLPFTAIMTLHNLDTTHIYI